MIKNRIGFKSIILFSILVFLGCSKTGEIAGTVVDRLTKKSVEGAIVKIKGTQYSAITNSLGYYKIEDVVPGQQKIYATKKGYDESSILNIAVSKGVVSKPESLEIRCISNECASVYQSNVSGTIIDFVTNLPVEKGSIKTVNNDITTDKNGIFILQNLLPGNSYNVLFQKENYSNSNFNVKTVGPFFLTEHGIFYAYPYPNERGVFLLSQKKFIKINKFENIKMKRGLLTTSHAIQPPPVVYIDEKQSDSFIKHAANYIAIYRTSIPIDKYYILPIKKFNALKTFWRNKAFVFPSGYYCGITSINKNIRWIGTDYKEEHYNLDSFTIIDKDNIIYIDISRLPSGKYILGNFYVAYWFWRQMPTKLEGYIFEIGTNN